MKLFLFHPIILTCLLFALARQGTYRLFLPPDGSNLIDITRYTDKSIDNLSAGSFVFASELVIEGDMDNDGIPDEDDNCPETPNANQRDKDNDGVGDACDPCNNNHYKSGCDDGDPCTENDRMDPYCVCTGVYSDSDNDGICDALDLCDGHDDHVDNNNNGLPDGCECEVMPVDAGTCKYVYYGYNPMECTTLTAMPLSGFAPYSYMWSTGAITPSISVCPQNTTVYTVTISDAYGCTGSDEVTVEVMDVRCGDNNRHVMICHYNTPTGTYYNLCQRAQLVQEHLDHGDRLGHCSYPLPCSGSYDYQVWSGHSEQDEMNEVQAPEVNISEHSSIQEFTVFPNPANEQIILKFNTEENTSVEWRLIDLSGNLLLAGRSLVLSREFYKTVDVSKIQSGMYFVQVTNGQQPLQSKIVIARL